LVSRHAHLGISLRFVVLVQSLAISNDAPAFDSSCLDAIPLESSRFVLIAWMKKTGGRDIKGPVVQLFSTPCSWDTSEIVKTIDQHFGAIAKF
jgi:hypothetical protein